MKKSNNNKINFNSKYKSIALFDDYLWINDILISYYIPLIKNNAYALYSFLVIESRNLAINSIFKTMDRIISVLNLSIEEINNSLSKLELVNLIEIFVDKKNRVIFELKKPLSPNLFNKYKQFNELLISIIGKENLEINNKLFNSLKINNNINFKSLTKEVEISLNKDGNFKKTLNVNYDFKNIKSIISAKGIDWNKFWNLEFEEKLLDLVVLYKVSDFDIAIELINGYENKDLNIDKIIKKMINDELDKNNTKKILNINDNFIDTKINLLKNMKVKDYFNSKLSRMPSPSESKMIIKFKKNYGFSDYIINILIDFSILINNGIINENYLDKIANTILKEKIIDANKLIDYLRNTYKLKKDGKTKSSLEKNKLMSDVPIFD